MYKLVIQDDEGKTTVVPLIRDELTIGRKEGNTIRLTERNVSRSHARLTRSNGTVVIEDLNSYNGIRVNGSRIQGRATIAETDRVQIGDYLIEIRSAAAEAGADDKTQPIDRMKATQEQETTQLPITAESSAPMAAAAAAVPPDVAALADTDPGRTASSVSNHGRLVVLSTNFPGQEFILDKASMVVGRTDENDIWLNHRSISRHHAKVVLENGRYSIEDLQSSNGVRVNGEEYGKVELRRADVIDLGHVRLRFVEPGEDFVFGRDAQPVEVFPEGGNKTWLIAGIAGVLLIGAIAAIMVMGRGGENEGGVTGDGDDPGSQIGVSPGTGAGTSEPVTIDAAPEVPVVEIDAAPEQPVSDKKLAGLISNANKLMSSKKWAEARNAANEALEIDPNNADAKKIAEVAGAELRAEGDLTELRSAVKRNEFRRVSSLKNKLDGTSKEPEASRLLKRAQDNEYKALVGAVRSAARSQDCDEHRSAIGKARVPGTKNRLRKITCKEKVEPGDGDGDGDGDKTDVEALKAELSGAARTNFPRAYQICSELSKAKALTQQARKKCVLAACADKNTSKAKRYFKGLRSAQAKQQMIQLCRGKGVVLP